MIKNNSNFVDMFGTKISQEIHFICDNNFKSNGWIEI
jgi:hypothetical protein